jgi:hypothetical protein
MHISRMFALVVIVSLWFAIKSTAQEKKIERSAVPPGVEKTVAAQGQGARVRGFSTETENGQVLYEAELMVAGHSKDILMDSAGNVVEVEEQVPTNLLPKSVQDGLQEKAGRGKLLKVESITKHGKLMAYEAQVSTGGKRTEIQVDPDGKPLDHAE